MLDNANVVVNHVLSELRPINKDHFLLNLIYELQCILRKARCSNQDSLACSLTDEAANEFANRLRADNGVSPSLGLDIYGIQTELVFFDYSIDTFVTALADSLTCITQGTAITHCNKQFDNQFLKESGRCVLYLV